MIGLVEPGFECLDFKHFDVRRYQEKVDYGDRCGTMFIGAVNIPVGGMFWIIGKFPSGEICA